MPVDTQHAAEGLRRRIAHTRKRRRLTLAVAASVVVAAVAVTVAGDWLGVNKAGDPAQSPDPSVAVAREFLDAYGSFDADTAISNLTDDAVAQGWDTHEGLRMELAHYRAQGYEQTINECRQVGSSKPGVSLLCAFDMHAIRSDEIGLGPYTGNNWHLTVRDGKVVSAKQVFAFTSNRYSVGRAFPLMEEFSQHGKSDRRVPPDERQPETLLLSRIRLSRGLDKC